jgi:VanZ family protein
VRKAFQISQGRPLPNPYARTMKKAAALFIAFLLLVVIAADLGWAQPLFLLVERLPGGDKTGHFLLVGLLGFFVNMAAGTPARGALVSRASLFLLVVVTLEEVSQLFLHFRGFSLADLAADYAGLLSFGWLAAYLKSRQPPLRPLSFTRQDSQKKGGHRPP